MATLILTAVGTAIGGPVGATIGSLLGQAIDARLFAPKGREGPRLSDLRVQTSSYGSVIPRLYGRIRVAGTVIWSTDLIEHRQRQSAGKGRGSVTSYSYSASFAVALSSRPIIGVKRIWAEGNILRGAAGDFKSATGFRLHSGDAGQPVDPLIAAAEGLADCPAYRGIAYALFEDMDLSPFGNRIPSLSFEVEADAVPINLSVPATDLCGTLDVRRALPDVHGLALTGPTRGEAMAALSPLLAMDRVPGTPDWRIGDDADTPAVTLPEPADDRGRARMVRKSGGGDTAPRQMRVAVYAPERDFQMIAPAAVVAGGSGPPETVALPIAADAATAKDWAGRLALTAAMARQRESYPAGFAALTISPGMRVGLSGADGARRVSERRIEGTTVRLTLEPDVDAFALNRSPPLADAGRAMAAPDQMIGPSHAWLFDLPVMDGVADGQRRLALAAAGSGAGWRQASMRLSLRPDGRMEDAGTIGAMGVLGTLVAIEGAATPWLIDAQGAVTVELLRESMMLTNADDAALLAGANLAVAGDELLQFGRAEPVGDRQWRLTRLLRGRLGTEDAMASIAAGQGFALIDDPALIILPGQMEAGARIELIGQGDAQPLSLTLAGDARARRPLSPCGLAARWQHDGGLAIRWLRRSRAGFGWLDRVDAPLDERRERYQVTLSAGGVFAVGESGDPWLDLSAAEVNAWRGHGATLTITVQQIGELGVSQPESLFHHL